MTAERILIPLVLLNLVLLLLDALVNAFAGVLGLF